MIQTLPRPRVAVCVLLVAILQACQSPANAPSVAATPASPSSPAPTATPASTLPATPPPDAAPQELQGEWVTELADDDKVTLRLGVTGYTIKRGSFTGTGQISVSGDVIEFSLHSGCDGAGSYRWQIADGILTFTPVGERDPCPRIGVLEGREYERKGT